MLRKIFPYILGVVVVVSFVSYFLFYKNNKNPTEQNTQQYSSTPTTNCGLTVINVLPYTTHTLPLEITAIVNNTHRETLGCSWTVFEGQAGTIQIQKENGENIGEPLLLTTKSTSWMTDESSIYSTILETLPDEFKGKINIIITEDNPSGEGTPKKIIVPVTIK